ncbi:hypothetical protein GQ55_6G191700 [Panicum hallii var. hallii]|uniref:Uncharacterized protein n=1 Tax=Panicum hallii var. hallii TaxID=1504633 RepID=A0A2T7D7C9_9POAL|nr:hypothetical protein GQ55_6G191700 [Panicum hallii var. hallii]
MAAAVAVEAELDPVAVRAAQILVSLRFRKLRERPEWLPAPAGEASSSPAPALEVPVGWARRRPRSRGRRGSAAPWRRALRELDLAAAGSAGEERDYAAPARRPAEAAAGSGSPSTSSAGRAARHADGKAAAHAAKEPMKASSPDTPLDYGAGGSGASSSADDAARPHAKRRAPGARGSGGGGASCADDDDGCSSPAKRARVLAADDEEPIPTGPSTQSETRASITKGLAFDLDLNLPPPSDDDNACPDAC